MSEERGGNQAQHTAVGLLRLGFHGHGHDGLQLPWSVGGRLAFGTLHGNLMTEYGVEKPILVMPM